MADLLARFKLVDEMSDKLGSMAESGQSMVAQWEQAGEAANNALEGIAGGVSTAVSSVDGVATSIENLQGAASSAASSGDTLADAMSSYGDAAGEAAEQTDYWTAAAENYSKSALEAVYSTEELVEMGLKSAEALEEQERMFELCEQSASSLSKSIDATAEIQEELSAAMEAASETTAELSKNEDVSAETKAALAKASVDAAEAMNELTAAQQEAEAAMAAYDEVMQSGTTDLDALEAAAERAGHAAEALAEANGKASDMTEELSKATEKAAEEAEEGGKKGANAVESIASALAAAGIVAKVKEIAEGVYELVDAFSEAESTVVKATGASGAALDGLTTSMMNAYAASKSGSLDDTAGAIGEINTRMGLTGDTLTTVTGQFLDFAEITGTNVVGSVQSVTKIMNKWNVESSEVESVLDRLAYAGQVSGISVDSLASTVTNSSATFQALGMNLDNAISLLADLELYGTSSQTTVTGLRTAVNNFTDDGLDAEVALRSVIEQIANMEDASEATALAVDTFGSRAGQELAGAIRSGAISVDSLTQSLEVADGTLSSTAETAQTLDQKWTQASNNISSAFTAAVQPALSGISGGLAGVANSIGTFLNEHPAVTKALTAIGVGIGVVVAGFALYTAGSALATAATALFGVTLSAAIWPITAIAAAVAAVTAAVLFLVDAFQEDLGATEGMTAATREQYYELQDLNAEYEEACEKYGETSEEALRLKYQVDDLSAAFEANRQTVEEFTAEVDALIQSHDELISSYEESMTAINQSEVGTLSLIQKLDDLASTTNRTAAQEEQMKAVIDQLNSDLPDLALSYDDVANSTEKSIEAMKKAAELQAEQERQAEQKQAYVDLLKEQANLEDEIAKAEENIRLEQERMDNMSGWEHFWTGGEWDDLEAYQDALDELNAAYAENQATLQGIEDEWEEVAQAAEEAATSPATYEEAVATAYEGVRAKVEELCAAYDEAYQAALESFEGQFGLFDEAEADMEATVANAQAALDSQLAYWENYGANIETLKNTSAEDLGVTQENYEALMAYAQSGSEEAAGLAASMAEAINSGNTEAVAALANTVGEVQAAQAQTAAAVADWQTDFTAQMDAIEKEMKDTIDGMDLSEEASAAASSTITSYAGKIRAGKSDAVAAAQEVASAVTSALSAANATIHVSVSSSGSVTGNAKGTTNAESLFLAGEQGPELVARPTAAYATGTTNSADYFIAGENGPELIVGEQGSTVFPTQETDRLIAALNEKRQPLQVFASSGGGGNAGGKETAQEQVKRILLEIAGSGEIEVSGNGADRETVLQIMWENLKPILMSIIQSEIYEEGELSYEY